MRTPAGMAKVRAEVRGRREREKGGAEKGEGQNDEVEGVKNDVIWRTVSGREGWL